MGEIAVFSHVSRTYGGAKGKIAALTDLSFELEAGESLAFLGPNGAGKTTTIKILAGLLSPDSGEVRVKGDRFFPGHRLQRIFGVALQEIGLWPLLTVEETVEFAARLYGGRGSDLEKDSREILGELDLGDRLKSRVETLSDGLKRRVSLACALIHSPEILILDEPSSGLDPRARLAFWNYLERLLKRKAMTLFLSTHDMDEADRFSGRVGILHKGRLVALDSPDALKAAHGKGDEIEFEFDFSSGEIFPAEILSGYPGVNVIVHESGKAKIHALNGIRQLPFLLSRFSEKGVEVKNLRVKPNTLEDVFMNLTGAELG